MIAYRDFVPRTLNADKVKNDDKKGFWQELTDAFTTQDNPYGTFDDIVTDVNEWLLESGVHVVTVETVVVPTLAPSTVSVHLRSDNMQLGNNTQQTSRFQFIRVWYRTE